MQMDHSLISTGDPRRDIQISLIRHSGNALWIILAMILLDEAFRWAARTELGHMVTDPIKRVGSRTLDGAYAFFKNRTWLIGPALIAAAGLLKQRVNPSDTKISATTDFQLRSFADSMKNLSLNSNGEGPVFKVKASELLTLSKILKRELGISGSLKDELSPDKISQLLGESGVNSNLKWDVVMDIDEAQLDHSATVTDKAQTYHKKLDALFRIDFEEAIDFGCTMLALQAHTSDVYDEQAKPEEFISFVEKYSAEDSPDDVKTVPIPTSSFLLNLRHVLEVSDDGGLVRDALLNDAALRGIADGTIRTELKLRELLGCKTAPVKSRKM